MQNNFIMRGYRGRIQCFIQYDPINKFYVVTRKTPRAIWTERTTEQLTAYRIYRNFLNKSIKTLEYMFFNGGLTK